MHAAMESAETFQNTSVEGSQGITAAGGIGEAGPIHFLVNRYSPAQQEAFFPAMQALGISETYEFLNGDPLGYMRHTSSILGTNYTRSYSPAFLPIAGSNLHIMVDTMVVKINLKDNCSATGVMLSNGTVIHAKKEVILSAGSIQSPQLLELSGIGNETILSGAGIKQLVNLPGVGENLQDHVRIVTAYQLKNNYTSPDILRFNATYAAQQQALYNAHETSIYDETSSGYAYLTWKMTLGNDSSLLTLAKQAADPDNTVDQRKLHNLKHDSSLNIPQLEVLFDDGYLGNKGYPAANSSLYGKQFFAMIASLNHLFSRGSTHINASNPTGHPLFDPNYLSQDYDLQAVVEGAKYIRKIAQTPPLSYTWVDQYEPGLNNVTTDADWVNFVKNNALSIWHPLGTCALLPQKDMGVVDPELRVYGVSNLRVADASVIPILISGHIQTAVYGIAFRAADLITERWSSHF